MSTLSPHQVYDLAKAHGFSAAGALGMVGVVATESGGRTDAVQPGGFGRGLVSIDLGQHPDVTEAQAFDPDFAMDWAFRYSDNGNPANLGDPLFYGPGDHPDTARAAQQEVLGNVEGSGLLDTVTGAVGNAVGAVGGILADPLGTVTGAAGDVAGAVTGPIVRAVQAMFERVTTDVAHAALAAVFVVGALGLVVAGAWKAVGAPKLRAKIDEAAQLAPLAAIA